MTVWVLMQFYLWLLSIGNRLTYYEKRLTNGVTVTDKKKPSNNTIKNDDSLEKVANLTTTLNPLIGVDSTSIFQSWMKKTSLIFKNPKVIMDLNLSYSNKIMGVMTNVKTFDPDKKDKRFQDTAWQEMPIYSYLCSHT